jgi:hypothetical protein
MGDHPVLGIQGFHLSPANCARIPIAFARFHYFIPFLLCNIPTLNLKQRRMP